MILNKPCPCPEFQLNLCLPAEPRKHWQNHIASIPSSDTLVVKTSQCDYGNIITHQQNSHWQSSIGRRQRIECVVTSTGLNPDPMLLHKERESHCLCSFMTGKWMVRENSALLNPRGAQRFLVLLRQSQLRIRSKLTLQPIPGQQ